MWEKYNKVFRAVNQAFPGRTSMLGVERLFPQQYNHVLTNVLNVKGCKFSRILHGNANGGYAGDELMQTATARNRSRVLAGKCNLAHVNFRLSQEMLHEQVRKWDRLYPRKKPNPLSEL